jgi:hypothetical protein
MKNNRKIKIIEMRIKIIESNILANKYCGIKFNESQYCSG